MCWKFTHAHTPPPIPSSQIFMRIKAPFLSSLNNANRLASSVSDSPLPTPVLPPSNPNRGVSDKLYCQACNVWASSHANMQAHLGGSSHAKRLNLLEGNVNLRCEVCDVNICGQQPMQEHLAGKAHKKKLASMGLARGAPVSRGGDEGYSAYGGSRGSSLGAYGNWVSESSAAYGHGDRAGGWRGAHPGYYY